MKRVTVYDVAKELGISTSTVSRVLNNSILIGSEKRETILAAARRLGYRKRPIKRQSRRAILNIALFLPVHPLVYTHLFYSPSDLLGGLYEGFGNVKVNIIARLTGQEDDFFASKKLGDIDGCVYAFSEPPGPVYRQIEDRGIPVVELNRVDAGRNHVACDDALGMETLLSRIAGSGRRPARPCYLGFSPIPAVNARRRDGFLAAAAGLSISAGTEDVRVLDALADMTPAFLGNLRGGGYNAVVCFNDLVAVYLYQAAVREGLRIPRDFSLTGFDNSPVLDLVSLRIDTVSLSVRQLGMEAGGWLRRRIIDRDDEGLRKLIAGEYVPGETIGV